MLDSVRNVVKAKDIRWRLTSLANVFEQCQIDESLPPNVSRVVFISRQYPQSRLPVARGHELFPIQFIADGVDLLAGRVSQFLSGSSTVQLINVVGNSSCKNWNQSLRRRIGRLV